jgi:putative SOS response-associated peptidase YedK
MCYNYSLTVFPNKDDYNAILKKEDKFENRYIVNSFDNQKMPVITNKNPNYFQFFYWGLIPYWIKNIEDSEKIRLKTINARSESIFNKPSFKRSIRLKRCLIPADGFFEWRYVNGINYPYYIRLKNHKIFSFAGLWDEWRNPINNEIVHSYSIITCKSNKLLSKIHNKKKRMPVILSKVNEKNWLNQKLNDNEIRKYLIPFSDEKMEAYTISRLITSKVKEKNIPEILKPFLYTELKKFD